jgi:selenocysteine lyase/cysteine desulfurase
MILENQSELFNIPDDVTFLNCANMSPLLKKVNQAGIEAINKRNNPWKIKIDDWFSPAEELRLLLANIIKGDKENIALIPSVSYGMAIAANNISLTNQQTIIILEQQYPSNVYAWRELSKRSGSKIITIKRELNQTWTEAIITKINSNTGLVAIPNCHWTDGSLIDLEKVSKAAKKVNAKLVIDASQSLGAYPLDISKIMPDFLVTVGYKWLLGPYGLGYLYADSKYFKTGKPIEFSWLNKLGSEDFTSLVDYTEEYKSGARRFDAGEFSSFIHIPMAIASLTQIIDWGVENIQDTLSELTDVIEKRARDLGLETPKRNSRVGHMIGIKFTDNQVSTLSKKLVDNKVFISFRGTSMRIAPHLYNDKKDIDKLFSFL